MWCGCGRGARPCLTHSNHLFTLRAALPGLAGGATLGEQAAAWLSGLLARTAPADTAAALQAQLAAQLAGQQQDQQQLQQQQGVPAERGQLCQCVGLALPAYQAESGSLPHYYYVRARLALCQFTCAHRPAVLALLGAQVAVVLVLAALLLARRAAAGGAAAAPLPAAKQFVVVTAADEEWRQPLLQQEV